MITHEACDAAIKFLLSNVARHGDNAASEKAQELLDGIKVDEAKDPVADALEPARNPPPPHVMPPTSSTPLV